jgi:hypothetical protein
VSFDGDRALLGVDVADTPAGGDNRSRAALTVAGVQGARAANGVDADLVSVVEVVVLQA